MPIHGGAVWARWCIRGLLPISMDLKDELPIGLIDMTFLIAETFTDSLARLTGDEQKSVKTAAFDLQKNPSIPAQPSKSGLGLGIWISRRRTLLPRGVPIQTIREGPFSDDAIKPVIEKVTTTSKEHNEFFFLCPRT